MQKPLSRIIQTATRIPCSHVALAGLSELGPKKAMGCSEYSYYAYSRLGIHTPLNHKGYIPPTDVASQPDISLVCGV